MNQPHENVASLQVQYTLKRLDILNGEAVLINISRRVVVIQVNDDNAIDQIQADDVLEVSIMLPHLYGVPRRHLYCRCHVDVVIRNEVGICFGLGVDMMQFRGERMSRRLRSQMKTLVM